MSENKRCYVHVQFKRSQLGGTASKEGNYDSKTYVYLAEMSAEEAKKFDYAVVISPHSGLEVVKVQAIDDVDESTYNGQYKYIVQFVDLADHYEREKRAKRRAAIIKELNLRAEAQAESERFERLFAGDTGAKALLDELKKLS